MLIPARWWGRRERRHANPRAHRGPDHSETLIILAVVGALVSVVALVAVVGWLT